MRKMLAISVEQNKLIESMFFVHRESYSLQLMRLQYALLQFKYDVLKSIIGL